MLWAQSWRGITGAGLGNGPFRIAVLHPSYDGSEAPFAQVDPWCDPSVYLPEYECVDFTIDKARAVRQVARIARAGFDVAINLCDGAWDEDRAGIEVVHALERMEMAFTGAGSLFYDPSRLAMKMACHSAGVRFPAYVMTRCGEHAEQALAHLRFPMLVKHPQGYASAGILRSSRVADEASLRREIDRVVGEYGAALVEEFIEGREFTVLVTEPRHGDEEAWSLQPVEFLFPAGESFKHFDLKWTDYERMETRPVRASDLAARLRQMSALAFTALGGSGYGRCDIRMDESGELYLLEINPNCAVFYPAGQFGSADFILANDPAGHRGFLGHQIDRALARRDRQRKPAEVRFSKKRGFGMFARWALRAGEIVERYEERPQSLVSRRYADGWRGLRRRWFEQYAWPLTHETHGLWSANPEEWRPMNHSRDPNTWLEGLDVVARRDIRVGEELTIDYATFCGPEMADFACTCGAGDCRRVVRGTDYLLTQVRARYGNHVSDFVRSQQTPGRAAAPGA